MRYLKYAGLLGLFVMLAGTAAHAQVRFGVGVGVDPGYVPPPAYVGPAPNCAYGYYGYSPYACAPYGYYGPAYFNGGVFIGAGPWFHYAAITGQVTAISGPIIIEGSMAVRGSATSVAAGSAAASAVDSGAAINSALGVGSGAASLVAASLGVAGDVNRRKSHLFCKRLALMPAVFFQRRQLDSYPYASNSWGASLTAN